MDVFTDPNEEWTAEEVAGRLERDDIVLIDVRETYEREAGHIPGSRHIELERLASDAESIPKDRVVVFQCRVGARSAMAARAFRAAGWDAHNLAGGVEDWVARGLPFEGTVADH
ncbi:MAG: rhodanese-like protein [Solirubrobacterales bacterium]|nr:rhodanese-like protein [Solirubrobacterales bacterium]